MTAKSEFEISQEASSRFAALSGDFNPLHIDPLAARRLLFGGAVPHGVHVLLCALGAAYAGYGKPIRLVSLKAVFSAPPRHASPISIESSAQPDGSTRILVVQDSVLLQTITANVADRAVDDIEVSDQAFPAASPKVVVSSDAAAQTGSIALRLDRSLAQSLMPDVVRFFPASQLAVLMAGTHVVGMHCPGLHSVFADLFLTFDTATAEADSALTYRVSRVEPRMSLIRLSVQGGGAVGEITAFFRPEPSVQPDAATVAKAVTAGEFAGQKVLIVGGSRGLGEIAAKLLAAGGAEVVLTFARGNEDARRVVNDIRANGGICESFGFDVLAPPEILPKVFPTEAVSHLYYFATPSIQVLKARGWREDLFRRYTDFYVAGLRRTLAAIDKSFAPGKATLALFYPSTVFIDNPRSGLAEYIAAKAAGEALCHALARERPLSRVSTPRLPMLKTDQTSALGARSGVADPAPILLAALRDFARA